MSERSTRARVCAVIVTYFPDFPILEGLLEQLLPQVNGAVIVDNTEDGGTGAWFGARCEDKRVSLIANGDNLGVAAAQNRGINWAREQGFSHVLLMDHDSIPEANMVAELLKAGDTLQADGAKVSAVGPRVVNMHTGLDMYFVRFGLLRFRKIWCPNAGGGVLPADFLLSSGSLVSMKTFDAVGGLEDGLFIDHVDTEWFLRARHMGFQAYGVCSARLSHKFGEGSKRLWLGYWRQFPRHNPIRHYYTYRNSVVLYRRRYAPLRWIVNDIIRLLKISVYYGVMVPPRWEHAKMMLRGLRDGLLGRQGKEGG